MTRPYRTTILLAMSLALALSSAMAAGAAERDSMAPAGTPPLFADLGTAYRAITTSSPEAQRYFDQGLRLQWSFSLEEAQRAYEEAERLDPTCAMCAWGTAMSLGPHVNFGATPERTVQAHRAAERARQRMGKASPVEQALIEAVARRYSDPAPTNPGDQRKLDQAYADAMRDVAKRFPDDADVATLYADALMNLQPWDNWSQDGKPRNATLEILDVLERTIARAPQHPGANHMYIHMVEAGPHPEKGLPSAHKLESMVPGQGHMVHMPGHIYMRLGRYAESSATNRRAIAADDRYREQVHPQGFYNMYMAHNHQFVMVGCWFEGRYQEAVREAGLTAAGLPVEMMRTMPGTDYALIYPIWTQVRFSKWSEVLAEPRVPDGFPYPSALWHAARALAYAARGKLDLAQSERDSLERYAGLLPEDAAEGLNPSRTLAGIARDVVDGTIAAERGQVDAAVAKLQAAVAAEDGLRYDEPSDWYVPVRHVLGAVLLDRQRYAAAQKVYEADLARNRENGWALKGLAKALRGQKRVKDAKAVEARLAKAWKNADAPIAEASSR
jgi:hypothetical protein